MFVNLKDFEDNKITVAVLALVLQTNAINLNLLDPKFNSANINSDLKNFCLTCVANKFFQIVKRHKNMI